MMTSTRSGRILLIVALGTFALLFSSCEALSSPQNTFAPAGDVAEDQKWYFIGVTIPAAIIGVGVMLACLLLPLVYRRKRGDPGLPKQVHGNTPLELTWTIIPAIMMAVVGIITVAGIVDLGREPSDDALRVNVTGQRFSWSFDYPSVQDGEGGALSAPINELHIPQDREIGLYINAVDVNHSFWMPKLAGKIDAIPNHENYMWIRATDPGIYAGQCAEFCGLQHSDMRFIIVVHTQDDFEAWLADQGDYQEVAPTPEPTEEPADGGADESEEEAGESARLQGD